MNYTTWFHSHAQKHKVIVEKLLQKGYTQEQIINYFDFENMCIAEKDFCPLYSEKKKCHDMQELNCYLCACPNFRFDDAGVIVLEGKTKYSYCHINSKDGKVGEFGDALHQDCSGCGVPHKVEYIENNFSVTWEKIMAKCNGGENK